MRETTPDTVVALSASEVRTLVDGESVVGDDIVIQPARPIASELLLELASAANE